MSIVPVIHTSKPNAQGKGGGVEYVEVSGPEVTATVWKHGLAALLKAVGLEHVAPADCYLSNTGYGDTRNLCVRVKRDVAEGRKPVASAKAPAAAKVAWKPGMSRGQHEVARQSAGPASEASSLKDMMAAMMARMQALEAPAAPAEVAPVVARRGRAKAA